MFLFEIKMLPLNTQKLHQYSGQNKTLMLYAKV